MPAMRRAPFLFWIALPRSAMLDQLSRLALNRFLGSREDGSVHSQECRRRYRRRGLARFGGAKRGPTSRDQIILPGCDLLKKFLLPLDVIVGGQKHREKLRVDVDRQLESISQILHLSHLGRGPAHPNLHSRLSFLFLKPHVADPSESR